jgi:hypothetical protein
MGRESRTHASKMNEYGILMGKPEGNRQLRIPRRRWEDNIKEIF